MTQTMNRWQADSGNVSISDGEITSYATFSAQASDETIVRDYLRDYGYCDPEQLVGSWLEGRLERNGETTEFWWKLTGETRGARYAYELRFTRPLPGEVRADGFRY